TIGISVGARCVMILEPMLVAPQPLLDADGRRICACISVGGARVGVQRDAGVEMDRAFGLKAEAVLRHRDVAGISAVQLFAQCLDNSRADALTQGFADVEIFSRDAKWH